MAAPIAPAAPVTTAVLPRSVIFGFAFQSLIQPDETSNTLHMNRTKAG
jgi:hypothetical protein